MLAKSNLKMLRRPVQVGSWECMSKGISIGIFHGGQGFNRNSLDQRNKKMNTYVQSNHYSFFQNKASWSLSSHSDDTEQEWAGMRDSIIVREDSHKIQHDHH